MASGIRSGTRRRHPEPRVGERFGELTVHSLRRGERGGVRDIFVTCGCGFGPYAVHEPNLRNGKSTRCHQCAKAKSAVSRKHYWGYADIVPDDAHRQRLLNRISAVITRCENPQSGSYAHYGGRGIRVYPAWLVGYGLGKRKRVPKGRQRFLAYLVTLAGWDNPDLELDRIDNSRGYRPGNLRFVTRQVNNANQRQVRELQSRIVELEARLRSCQCWT